MARKCKRSSARSRALRKSSLGGRSIWWSENAAANFILDGVPGTSRRLSESLLKHAVRRRRHPVWQGLAAASNRSCDMERIAPKPPMIMNRMRIGGVSPAQLTDRLTGLENLLELSSMGVPDVDSRDWKLDITGLVNRSTYITFEELKRLPKRSLETVFVCSGDPRRPTTPLRRVANVKWGGVDLAGLLDRAGVRSGATHLW